MRVAVGRLGRPHGIRGEVTVEVRTDEPERRFAVGAVLHPEPARTTPLVVESTRWHGSALLVRFAGVPDRTAAETLRGTLVHADVDEQDRPADEDEFYDHQLIGMSVLLMDGTVVGTLSEVLHLPGHDLLAVDAVVNGQRREVLVPFVASIVPVVDVDTRTVRIDPPEGLLTLGEDGA